MANILWRVPLISNGLDWDIRRSFSVYESFQNILPGTFPTYTTFTGIHLYHSVESGRFFWGDQSVESFQSLPCTIPVVQGQGAGTAVGDATASGTLDAFADLPGTSQGDASASGTASDLADFAGSAQGDATTSGTASDLADFNGSASGDATASGTLDALASLAGTAQGDATASGTASDLADFAGTATGDATASSTASDLADFAGTATGDAIVNAAPQYDGSASGDATASGTLDALANQSGSATGDAIASGTADDLADFAGTAAGDAIASGALTALADFAGSAQGDAIADGSADPGLTQGAATGDATASATLDALADFAGTAAGDATADAVGASDNFQDCDGLAQGDANAQGFIENATPVVVTTPEFGYAGGVRKLPLRKSKKRKRLEDEIDELVAEIRSRIVEIPPYEEPPFIREIAQAQLMATMALRNEVTIDELYDHARILREYVQELDDEEALLLAAI